MRLSHGSPALSATFDDPNLVSVGGLAPVLALAQSGGLAELVADKLGHNCSGDRRDPYVSAGGLGEDVEGAAAVLGRGL
jgi:hypothetical protein